MVNDKINSLVIYDIVNDKQRIQFAKFMESYGDRVQKSAFEVRLNRRKMERMIMEKGNRIFFPIMMTWLICPHHQDHL